MLAALWDEEGRIDDFEQGVQILKGSPGFQSGHEFVGGNSKSSISK